MKIAGNSVHTRLLSSALEENLATELGCAPGDDPLGLLVDRSLARSGLLPREALAELSLTQRVVVLEGRAEETASAHVVGLTSGA